MEEVAEEPGLAKVEQSHCALPLGEGQAHQARRQGGERSRGDALGPHRLDAGQTRQGMIMNQEVCLRAFRNNKKTKRENARL